MKKLLLIILIVILAVLVILANKPKPTEPIRIIDPIPTSNYA